MYGAEWLSRSCPTIADEPLVGIALGGPSAVHRPTDRRTELTNFIPQCAELSNGYRRCRERENLGTRPPCRHARSVCSVAAASARTSPPARARSKNGAKRKYQYPLGVGGIPLESEEGKSLPVFR
jgi:hypothetical protein